MSKHTSKHTHKANTHTNPTNNDNLQVFVGDEEAEADDYYYEEDLGEGGGDGEDELDGNEEGGGDAGADAKDEAADEEEQGDQAKKAKSETDAQLVKPHLWVRVKPGNFDSKIYEIAGKTLNLTVKPEDRLFQKKSGKTVCFSFETEGILQEVTQDEMYDLSVKEVVENAIQGIDGVVICVGPEASGKFFTLFGPSGDFQLRGILPRAVDDIFKAIQGKEQAEYHIILSMFEIRKDRIKDLLTLSPVELSRVGDFGPKGLFFEEVLSFDHALVLILRGIAGQQQMPRDSSAKFHTLVYIDILAKIEECGDAKEWRSRITFAKIAASPSKANIKKAQDGGRSTKNNFSLCRTACIRTTKDTCGSDGVPRRCCGGGPPAALAEMISIRKDMSFLEQMFSKSYDLRKINEYYAELQKMGMYMLGRPPTRSSSQYYRQNKLAYCLKDIVSGTALVRLIIHVRAERAFLQPTIEVMRLAERARCIPCQIPKSNQKCRSAEQKMVQIYDEIGISNASELAFADGNISPEKLKEAHKVAMQFFEEKLDTLDGPCKDQVKTMFEGFKEMWNHFLDKEVDEAKEEEAGLEDEEKETQQNEASTEKETQQKEASTEKESLVRASTSQVSVGSTKKNKQDKDDARSTEKEEPKKNKKNRRASASKTRSKRQDTLKDDESVDSNVSKKREKPGATKTMSGISTKLDVEDDEEEEEGDEMSVDEFLPSEQNSTAILSNSTDDVSSPTNAVLFKRKCWKKFAKSEVGTPLIADFAEKQGILKQYINDHNEAMKEVVNFLPKLVDLQLNLDNIEKDRLLRDEIDESGNLVPGSKENDLTPKVEAAVQNLQELLEKLQNQRNNIFDQISVLDANKKECQKAFQNFCSEAFGKVPDMKNLPLNCLEHSLSAIAQEVLGFPKLDLPSSDSQTKLKDDSEAEKRFEEISRSAKYAAEALIKKVYPKRPKWNMFY